MRNSCMKFQNTILNLKRFLIYQVFYVYPHAFFKKSDGDIAIASICPSVRHAISSLTIGRNPTIFGVCVAHMNGVCNGSFFGPFPWVPGKGPKCRILLNIIKFQLQSQFQRFLNQNLCVYSQMEDIKHIRRDFHSTVLVMPKGWDFAQTLARGCQPAAGVTVSAGEGKCRGRERINLFKNKLRLALARDIRRRGWRECLCRLLQQHGRAAAVCGCLTKRAEDLGARWSAWGLGSIFSQNSTRVGV